MKFILIFIALIASSPAIAQTVTVGEAKVSVVFYVKEDTNSPYQGLLQLSVPDYTAIKPAVIRTMMLAQFNDWKVATKAAQDAPVVPPSPDDLAAQVKELRAQADALAADPAVAEKLGK